MGHVIGLVLALAHGATVQGLDADHSAQGLPRVATGLVALPWRHRRFGRRGRLRRARQVVAALRGPGDQRRGDEGHHQGHHGREGLRQLAQPAHVGHHRHQRGQAHRAHAHRVDVVQVARLNSMPLGDQPSGLLITRSATTAIIQAIAMLEYRPSTLPSAWNTFISISMKAIRVLNTTHTTRPGWLCVSREKEVRPRQRAGIGVGDVDLELRDHHEQGHRADGPRGRRENLLPRHQVHLVRVHGALRGNGIADRQPGQQRPAQHLQHPRDHPAGPAHEHRRPTSARPLRTRFSGMKRR